MSKNKEKPEAGFSTRAVHAGVEPSPVFNAIMTPVYFTSTYVQKSPGVFYGNYEYARTGNPTRSALEENLAALEGGRFGRCFASGLAATDAMMHTLKSGDHVVCCDDVYGGTYRMFTRMFTKFGFEYDFIDLTNAAALEGAVKKNTKLVWIETPTNPLLKLIDIKAVSAIAHKHGCKVLVDNTFCSPYLQCPLALGADAVLYSTTKYVGGHSDVIGGAIVTSDDEIAKELHFLQMAIGAVPSPMDCFLILRSTKTLALRMERHCENATAVAQFLTERDDIEKVIYPGLKTHPQYALAKQQMRAPGGMITIVLKGGLERARAFLEIIELFSLAESLGGVESLIEHPAIMTHASIPPERRAELGIVDGLVRLSVGIEDKEDLIADLARALDETRR